MYVILIFHHIDHYERDIIDKQQQTYLNSSSISNSSCFKPIAIVHDFYKEHLHMYVILIFHTCVQILKFHRINMWPPWSRSVYVCDLSKENLCTNLQLLNHSFTATTKHISQPLKSHVHIITTTYLSLLVIIIKDQTNMFISHYNYFRSIKSKPTSCFLVHTHFRSNHPFITHKFHTYHFDLHLII